ncbi:hypothetical protein [Moorena sp. SIOASIH]|uniref:hypothetical protein n=1 Tax=Moorena sp. SIOASIH TaxID=2607817 RepID=UPI0025D0E738|nr:hypothetical protein [Moorena sp. SIOASIH]
MSVYRCCLSLLSTQIENYASPLATLFPLFPVPCSLFPIPKFNKSAFCFNSK